MNHDFDPSGYIRSLYDITAPPMPDLDPPKLRLWQQELRQKLVSLLGGLPMEKCPLNVQEEQPVNMGWYDRQKVIFTSRPGMDVPAYRLTPTHTPRSDAAMICLHGHGEGVMSIIGLNPDGSPREEFTGMYKDYALQCVKHGYDVLAIEQVCFGERREACAKAKGLMEWSCDPISGAALLLGQTTLGWRVWDVMRAMDYLSARGDVDSSRIGVMGTSGGGTAALFSAALDLRIKAAVVSGYLNTFLACIMSMPHCICNYVPGILEHAEMYHIAGLVAPRPLFIETATHDPIFPVEAAKWAYSQAGQIYEALNAGDKIAIDIFEGEHEFHGGPCFDFLKERL